MVENLPMQEYSMESEETDERPPRRVRLESEDCERSGPSSLGSDELHRLDSVILLRRVLPQRAFYILVCLLCSANAIAMLCIFWKTLMEQPFALWEFYAIFAGLPAALALYELRIWNPDRSQGKKFEDMCSHADSLLAVCLSMSIPLNAKIYQQANPHISNQPVVHKAAWPTGYICYYFTYALAICFLLQFLYIPKKRPELSTFTCKTLVGMMAFYVELGTLVFFLFFYWPNIKSVYAGITAIADNGNQWLPVQAVLLIETARFLHTGDWQGIPVMAIFQVGNWIIGLAIWEPPNKDALNFFWDEAEIYSHGILIGLAIVQLFLLLSAIKWFPMRLRPSRLHDSHQSFREGRRIMLPESATRRRAVVFVSSFVGQNLFFVANGVFSFILYKSSENKFEQEMRGSVVINISGFGQYFDTSKLIKVTWVLALLSIIVACYNIFVDRAHKCEGRIVNTIISIFPHDSQFRLLAYLKAEMVWLKVAILGFTDYGSTSSPVSTQFVAIMGTVGCLGIATYTALDYARKALPLPYMQGKYRSCKALLVCIVLSNVTIQFLTMVLIVGKLTSAFWGDDASFVVAMRQIYPGTILSLGSYYSYIWICFLNEFTCHIRGIGLCLWFASPRGTYSVNMPTGMRALAVNLVSYPAILFMDTMLDCNPSRLGNMLTGYPFGGYEGSWAPPAVTYPSMLLVGIAFVAYWAAGPPDPTAE